MLPAVCIPPSGRCTGGFCTLHKNRNISWQNSISCIAGEYKALNVSRLDSRYCGSNKLVTNWEVFRKNTVVHGLWHNYYDDGWLRCAIFHFIEHPSDYFPQFASISILCNSAFIHTLHCKMVMAVKPSLTFVFIGKIKKTVKSCRPPVLKCHASSSEGGIFSC